MSAPLRTAQFVDPQGAFVYDISGNVLLGQGNTPPADTSAGYAVGALWFDLNAAAGSQWLRNDGTTSSCDFNILNGGMDLSALVTTVTELNLLSGLLATAAELNASAKRSTKVIPLTTTPIAITEATHNQKIMYITKTDGIAITLPAAAAGLEFTFVIGATIASASTIKSATGADIMIGHATMGNDSTNATVDWQAVASNTYDTIDLLGTSNSTGGIEGQVIKIIGLAANKWFVEIQGDAAGTEATPFADTVA